MPKGNRKRTAEEYEKEIQEAAARMRKRPEHLKAARSNSAWLQFLEDIGVVIETEGKEEFWGKVREELKPQITTSQREEPKIRMPNPRSRAYDKALIKPQINYHDAKGRFTKQKTKTVSLGYRDIESKQVMSKAEAIKRLKRS